MKNFFATCVAIASLFFGTANAEVYTVKAGDTLGKIAGKNWKAVCEMNSLKNCNTIRVGQKLSLDATPVKLPKTRLAATLSVKTCITLGAAPFNPGHSLKRTLEGIELLTTLTSAQKDVAKAKVLLGEKATENELVGQQVFKEMLYQSRSTKKVVHVYNKLICNPETGGVPEVMDTYALGGGVFFSIPRRCGNPSTFYVRPIPPAPPVVVAPQKPQPPVVSEEPQEIAPKEAIYRWDWELVVGQEYDRTAHSTFVSGAIYPLIVDGVGAEHAFGIGGMYSGWNGKTDTGYAFDGKLSGFGPAYKYSSYEGGYDFGIKILPWASLSENGNGGSYQSHRNFDLQGIALSYNNYERELKGEKSFFKYQLFASAFKPTGTDVGHTWEGKPISDTTELAKLDSVVNLGGRVGLYDFSKEDDKIGAKLWGSVGWFQEDPGAESANFRISLSDKHERFMFGIGQNYDLLNGGSVFGYGFSWDVRKTVWVAREESRKGQFIAAIEKAGGSLDKDGMVRLPQKQYKPAPSDN